MQHPLHVLVAGRGILPAPDELQGVFRTLGVQPPVHFARSGQELLDYLEGKPPFDDPVRYPLPTVILLDLNLPDINGLAVLQRIRSHPGLRRILVTALSSPSESEQCARAYESGATACAHRPDNPTEIVNMVENVQRMWAGIPAGKAEELPATVLAV